MAQFRKDTQAYLPQEKTIFEVNMLSTPDGEVVSNTNPLPVTLGDAVIEITSNNVNVTVPNTISVNSSNSNPVHVHITQMGAVELDDTATYLPIGGNVSANIFHSTGAPITNTNPLPVITVVNANAVSADVAPFEWQVALGRIQNATQVNIFGYSNTISSNYSSVWENSPADYVFLSAAHQLSVNSSISTDDSCKVLITGLNSTWDPISEVVTLNGVTPVTTANSFLRVNSMAMTQPGAGQNSNIGHITARYNSTPVAIIDPLIGRTQMSVYSVANGYSLYVQNINMFSGDAAGASKFMNFRVDVYNSITNINYILLHTTWQNAYQLPRSNPFKYGQKQDIKWQMASNSNEYSGSAIIEGTLIKDQ